MNRTSKYGFTVIELMVAMSMFLVLIGVATGTFLETLRMQKVITELTAANNNATQAIEQISREIRTGFNFQESTKDILKFVNYKSELVWYKLGTSNDSDVCDQTGDAVGCLLKSNDGGSTWSAITAPEVKVKRFDVIVAGAEGTDLFPPRVTLVISIAGPKNIDVNLQTTISSRVSESDIN